MSRRRKIDSENVGERVSTSLRMPAELLERIDHAWKDSGEYTGRTHFIEAACNYYLDCTPCPKCGHLNYRSSVVCSHCEEKLKPFQDCANIIKNVLEIYDKSFKVISEGMESYDNLFEKIGWLIDKLRSENQESAKDIISSTLKSMEEDILIARVFLLCHKLYSEYDQLPIPTPFSMLQMHNDSFQEFRNRLNLIGSSGHNPGYDNRSLSACVSTNHHYRMAQLVVQNPFSLQFRDLEEVLRNLDNSGFYIGSVANNVKSALRNLQAVEKLTDVLLQYP